MRILVWLSVVFLAFFVALTIALAVALSSSPPSFASGGSFPAGASVANLNPEQLRNAAIALRVADRLHAPPLAVAAEMVAALGESRLIPTVNSLGYGGVFQGAVATSGVNYFANDDTEAEAHYFLLGGKGFNAGGAIHLAVTQPGLTPGAIATMVESGGQPASFYDAHLHDALAIIAAWRSGASPDSPLGAGESVSADGAWLATVPGTALQCDRRIVPDVVMLVERYHLTLTACYAPSGHEPNGEHPLGLAVDVVPAPPATWAMLGQLARDAGWRPECASTGCASQTHTVFRFVGWNGYPGHGDPDHCQCGSNAHLHLSWNHGLGRPASSVQVLSTG